MCGIAGIFNTDNKPVSKTNLKKMVNIQRHRGPDDEGYKSLAENTLGFGFCRLSIIDLSPAGNQPMSNEDDSIWIIHNGEIFNYIELTKDLKAKGHIFKSTSDTETILHAYEEWGVDCLKKFNGMFAFAVWDYRKKHLFCARDHFGIKPLYYYYDRSMFAFASEIKALLQIPEIEKNPNNQSIYNYLSSGYGFMDISENTFFEGIKQLKAAHYLILKDNKLSFNKYWDLNEKNQINNTEKSTEKFLELFTESIRLRLRSDVPLGIALSGGLDSCSMSCIISDFTNLSSLQTFSSCFEEEQFDERKYIKILSQKLNLNNHFIFPTSKGLFSEIEKVIWHQDEPYAGPSIYAQWCVMCSAKQNGIKVLLTGQGGDEILAGYHKYYPYYFADLLKDLQWKTAVHEFNIHSSFNNFRFDVMKSTLKILLFYLLPHNLKALLKTFFSSNPDYLSTEFTKNYKSDINIDKKYSSILTNDLYNALKISPLPSLLHIDDRNSMAFSIESRPPFLDYRLVEFLFSLPSMQKIQNGFTKYILRSAFEGILPDEIRLRRDKMGFVTPLKKWLKKEIKGEVYDVLNSESFKNRGYFKSAAVMKILNEHISGKKDHQFTIWSWLNLELWFRLFIDK